MTEFSRIARFFAPLARNAPEAASLLDDAAFISPRAGSQWVITTDAISEGVHFIGSEPPALIARKLLRSNLSDLAAKGATPKFYTLNVMLPVATQDDWLEAFASGLAEDQARFGIQLIGGDSITVKGTYKSFSITAFGEMPEGSAPLRRSCAQIGDIIAISGTLGMAALGLLEAGAASGFGLQALENQPYLRRFLLPEPRLVLGQALCGVAHSCMDISDGLLQDSGHIARASDVKLVLDFEAIPTVADAPITPMQAMTHGDDYELLFTCAAVAWPRVQEIAATCGVSVTAIGRVEAGSGMALRDATGQDITPAYKGFQH